MTVEFFFNFFGGVGGAGAGPSAAARYRMRTAGLDQPWPEELYADEPTDGNFALVVIRKVAVVAELEPAEIILPRQRPLRGMPAYGQHRLPEETPPRDLEGLMAAWRVSPLAVAEERPQVMWVPIPGDLGRSVMEAAPAWPCGGGEDDHAPMPAAVIAAVMPGWGAAAPL